MNVKPNVRLWLCGVESSFCRAFRTCCCEAGGGVEDEEGEDEDEDEDAQARVVWDIVIMKAVRESRWVVDKRDVSELFRESLITGSRRETRMMIVQGADDIVLSLSNDGGCSHSRSRT